MLDVPEQPIMHNTRKFAESAGRLSRTIHSRPEAKASFELAFAQATENGHKKRMLTAELLGKYSQEAMKYTGLTGDWESRYSHSRQIQIVQRSLDKFYSDLHSRGELTIGLLGQLYDQLNINEPMVDGNKRASILAITHVLTQFGYPPPDFSNTTHDRLAELQKQYPGNHKKATVEFLRECVGPIPLQ